MSKKIVLSLVAIIIGLIGVSGFYISKSKRLQGENDSLNISIKNTINESDSVKSLYVLNRKAFKQTVKENDSLRADLKEAGIKIRNLSSVTKIQIKDEGKIDTFYIEKKDTLKGVWSYRFNDGCFSFDQEIYIDSAKIITSNIKYNNTLQIFHYTKKEKTGRKWLWVFNRKRKVADVYIKSQCGEAIYRQFKIK